MGGGYDIPMGEPLRRLCVLRDDHFSAICSVFSFSSSFLSSALLWEEGGRGRGA